MKIKITFFYILICVFVNLHYQDILHSATPMPIEDKIKRRAAKKQLKNKKQKIKQEKVKYINTRIQNIKIPNFVTLKDEKRILNGYSASKSKFFFNIKVSLVALYLKNKTSDGIKILKSKNSKLIKMVFLLGVSGKQIQKDLQKSFEKNCKLEECKKFKTVFEFSKFPKFKKFDTLDFKIFSSKIIAKKNGKFIHEFLADGLGEIMLRSWVGENVSDEHRKLRLLGLKKG